MGIRTFPIPMQPGEVFPPSRNADWQPHGDPEGPDPYVVRKRIPAWQEQAKQDRGEGTSLVLIAAVVLSLLCLILMFSNLTVH